jgi:hypothetical protein
MERGKQRFHDEEHRVSDASPDDASRIALRRMAAAAVLAPPSFPTSEVVGLVER